MNLCSTTDAVSTLLLYRSRDQWVSVSQSEAEYRYGLRHKRVLQTRNTASTTGVQEAGWRRSSQDAFCSYQVLLWKLNMEEEVSETRQCLANSRVDLDGSSHHEFSKLVGKLPKPQVIALKPCKTLHREEFRIFS